MGLVGCHGLRFGMDNCFCFGGLLCFRDYCICVGRCFAF